MKKMQAGGSAGKMVKKAIKTSPEYKAAKKVDDAIEKRYPNYTGKGSLYQSAKDAAKKAVKAMIPGKKTGGSVRKAK